METKPLLPWLAGMLTASVLLTCTGGCAIINSNTPSFVPTEQTRQLDQLIARQQGKVFRSEPYLEMAAGLQTMPRDQAEGLLRTWAHSGKYDTEVLVLCRMLFVGKDGTPLAESPYLPIVLIFTATNAHPPYWKTEAKFSFGGTKSTDWPDWPLAIVSGVPFCIQAAPAAYSGPYPGEPLPLQAPGYLDYCLKNGQWTTQRYAPVNLAERQKALEALLHSTTWKRGLSPQAMAYLTYQTGGQAASNEPSVPVH